MGAEAAPSPTPGSPAGAATGGCDFSPAPVGADFGGLLPWGAPVEMRGGDSSEGLQSTDAGALEALSSGLGAAGVWVLGAAAGGPQHPPPQSPGAIGRSVQSIVAAHAESVANTRARCQELESEAHTLRARVSARGSQLSELRAEVGGLRAKLRRSGISPSPFRPGGGYDPGAASPVPKGRLEGAFALARGDELVEGRNPSPNAEDRWRARASDLELEIQVAREEAGATKRECQALKAESGLVSRGEAALDSSGPATVARESALWQKRAEVAEDAVQAASMTAAQLTAERDEWEARACDLGKRLEELQSEASAREAVNPGDDERGQLAQEAQVAARAAAEAAADELARLTAERDEWEARAGDLLTELEGLQQARSYSEQQMGELEGLQGRCAEAESDASIAAKERDELTSLSKDLKARLEGLQTSAQGEAELAVKAAHQEAAAEITRVQAERNEWEARAGDLLTELEELQAAGVGAERGMAELQRRITEAEASAAGAVRERDAWEARAGDLLTDLEELQGAASGLRDAREEADDLQSRLNEALETAEQQESDLIQAQAVESEARGAAAQLLSDLRQQERKSEALGGCVAALESKLEKERRATKRLQDLVGEAHSSLQAVRAGKTEAERALGESLERNEKAEAEAGRLKEQLAAQTKEATAALASKAAEAARLAEELEGRLSPEKEQALVVRAAAEVAARRRAHNELQDYKGAIRVFCRVRPFLDPGCAGGGGDPAAGESGALHVVSREGVRLDDPLRGATYQFAFDRVFGPKAGQAKVFSEIQGLVQSVIDGYDVCIFSYGQTGSGKTHTMTGTSDDPGVNVRSLHALFKWAKGRRKEATARGSGGDGSHGDGGEELVGISVSILEIYNETLRDLLAEPPAPGDIAPPKLEVRAVGGDPTGAGRVHVPGLTERPVNSLSEVFSLMEVGERNRAKACTNLNEHSSRSHALVSVTVTTRAASAELGGEPGPTRSARLHLVDLAGSERVARSHATGVHMKEAQSINKSLSMLGDIIAALQKRASHVPYRNSRLTHLLSNSLGGGGKVIMIANVSPRAEDVAETLSSLQFADKVKRVELGRARRAHEGPRAEAEAAPRLPRPPRLAAPDASAPAFGPSPRAARSPGTPTGSIFAPAP